MRGPAPSKVRGDAATVPSPARAGAPPVEARDDLDDLELAELERIRAELDPATLADIEANESADPDALPDNVREDGDGTWLLTLQHPLEPTRDDPEGRDLQKIRVPERIFARNIRDADRHGKGEYDTMLHLAASMTKVPAKILERMDSRDFATLSTLVGRRARGLPT